MCSTFNSFMATRKYMSIKNYMLRQKELCVIRQITRWDACWERRGLPMEPWGRLSGRSCVYVGSARMHTGLWSGGGELLFKNLISLRTSWILETGTCPRTRAEECQCGSSLFPFDWSSQGDWKEVGRNGWRQCQAKGSRVHSDIHGEGNELICALIRLA